MHIESHIGFVAIVTDIKENTAFLPHVKLLFCSPVCTEERWVDPSRDGFEAKCIKNLNPEVTPRCVSWLACIMQHIVVMWLVGRKRPTFMHAKS